MNVPNPDLSPSQDDLDLPLKAEFPSFPSTNYTNFSLPSPDRHSSDTFISCSPPDSPSNCLISSPAPSPSPSSNIISDSSVLPIPSPPGHLSFSEQHSCEYNETESCHQIRLSSELPSSQSYQYSISQNEESPSISIHPVIKRLSSSPAEFPSPSVSLIPLPLPLTEKTPLLSGDRPNEDYQELPSCSPPPPPPPVSPPSMSSVNPQTINTLSSQFIDDSCILRLSPPHRKPFYSLSPNSELSFDDKSPLAIPSSSSSSPPPPNLHCGDDLAEGTGTDVVSDTGSAFDSLMVKAEVGDKKDAQLIDSTICLETDIKPSTSFSSDKGSIRPIQSVPCIVDLTGDDEPIDEGDDDEVEIVSSDQPVVYLGRETNSSNISSSSGSSISTRRSRKRKRHESSRVESTTAEETIIINDSVHDEVPQSSDGPSSSYSDIATIINVADSPERTDDAATSINNSNSSSNSCSNRINSGIFELSSPHLFGDLLNSSVIPLDNDTSRTHTNEVLSSSSSVCTCSSASSSDGRLCNAHQYHHHHPRTTTNLLPHMAIYRCDSREDRRQSSMNPPPPLPPPPPPQPPVVIGGRTSFMDAPIPQDVINDLQSLLEDDHRHRSTSYLRNYLFAPTGSGASGSSSDYIMSGRQRPGLVSRILPELSIEVEVHPSSSFSSTSSQGSPSSAINAAASTADSSTSSSSSLKGSSLDLADDSGGLSCPICFESFQDIKNEGRSLSSTVCGHIFCTTCLEASLKQTKQCPTCRKRLRKKQYHPLYI